MAEGLRLKKVASLLGVSVKTVRRWIYEGRLRAYRMGGLLLVPRTEILRIRAYREHDIYPPIV